MKLIIIRHGQAQHNLGGEDMHTFAGQNDNNGLTLEGIETVKMLTKKILADGKVDLIVSSSLRRSQETATIMASETKAPVKSFKDLDEIDVGNFEGVNEQESRARYPKEAAAFYDGEINHWDFPGGENFEQAKTRVKHLISALKEVTTENERILICGHGLINRLIFYLYLPERIDLWKERRYPHDRIVNLNKII